MNELGGQGEAIRDQAKALVLKFMSASLACGPDAEGMRQAEIFRSCGLDWGDKAKAPSTQQQFWLVALLRALEEEFLVEQVGQSGPWRLRR